MFTEVPKRGIKVILIASMVAIGTVSYIPTAFAENSMPTEENAVTAPLAKLEIAGVPLNQEFSADIHDYFATVDNGVDTISLLLKASNLDAVITVNGQTVKSDLAESFTLQTGENNFLITVKGEGQTVSTYTLTVTRKQNANNSLQTIQLSAGELSPKFSSEITNYNVKVTKDISSITVTPTAIEATSKVEVDGLEVKNKGISVNVPVGKSEISIGVTAESGLKKTYTLSITRDSGADLPSTNPTQTISPVQTGNRNSTFQMTSQQLNNGSTEKTSKVTLSALVVSEGSWDSTFSSNEYTYHIDVANDVKTITVNPTVSYSDSKVLIEGTTSKTIQLEDDGKTIISVVITNGDDDRKTYVLVFDQVK